LTREAFILPAERKESKARRAPGVEFPRTRRISPENQTGLFLPDALLALEIQL
jgi:hypothetical protein